MAYTIDITQYGTYAARSVYSSSTSYQASNAFDGNPATYWHSVNTSGNWIQVDYGEGKAARVEKVVFQQAGSYQTAPVLQGSNNASEWTSIFTLTTPSSDMYTFEFTNDKIFRYYRLLANNSTYMIVYTLEMYGDYIPFDDIIDLSVTTTKDTYFWQEDIDLDSINIQLTVPGSITVGLPASYANIDFDTSRQAAVQVITVEFYGHTDTFNIEVMYEYVDKSLGRLVVIEFTEKLTGDISGYSYDPPVSAYTRPIGIASASDYEGTSYLPEFMFDGNTSTAWYSYDTSGAAKWVMIELDSPMVTSGFRWNTRSSYYPKNFTVEASQDGEVWETLYTGTNTTYNWQAFNWNTTIPYKYYRWNILTQYNSSQLFIYEIELLAVQGNEKAFTLTGQRKQYLGGPTINDEYTIARVELHPSHTDDKHLLLYVKSDDGAYNAISDLTLTYDKDLGTLQGRGGKIDSFTVTFTPEDLVPVPYPNTVENIAVSALADVVVVKVTFDECYTNDSIGVAAIVDIVVVDTTIVNP